MVVPRGKWFAIRAGPGEEYSLVGNRNHLGRYILSPDLGRERKQRSILAQEPPDQVLAREVGPDVDCRGGTQGLCSPRPTITMRFHDTYKCGHGRARKVLTRKGTQQPVEDRFRPFCRGGGRACRAPKPGGQPQATAKAKQTLPWPPIPEGHLFRCVRAG